MKNLVLLFFIIAISSCSNHKNQDINKLSGIYLKLEIAKQTKDNFKEFKAYKDSLLTSNSLNKEMYNSLLKEIFSEKESLEIFHDSVYAKLNRLKEIHAKKDSLGGI